jgi:hypothetical protein
MHLNVSSHCWICEGWSRIEFNIEKSKVTKTLEGGVKRPQVFVHLKFDGYKPLKMHDLGDKFQTFRMVPPGTLEYFYTIKGKEELTLAVIADDVSP